MQSIRLKIILGMAVMFSFMLPGLAVAQESPAPLTEMWVLVPKADHGADFKKGLAEHMAFRSEHGDPRSWQSYTPMLGDDLNRVGIRFCCFNWADQDAYAEWSESAEKVAAHFDKHVAPHVEKASHYFETIDWPNSHWGAEDGPYTYFAVTEFHLKPGRAGQFDAARDKMSQIALNQGWATDDHVWLWSSTIGGEPRESIVVPHENFASMARDEESFRRFLSKRMGSMDAAAELLASFADSTSGTSFQIWKHQKEMSMSEGE
jgi:hypothetical protein